MPLRNIQHFCVSPFTLKHWQDSVSVFHQHHLLNLHTHRVELCYSTWRPQIRKTLITCSQANIKLNTTKEKTNKLDWAERGNMNLLINTVHYAKCWKHGTPMTYQGAEERNDRSDMHLCRLHFKKGRRQVGEWVKSHRQHCWIFLRTQKKRWKPPRILKIILTK